MRREEFEIFHPGDFLGLALDCAYYAWQNGQITDEEFDLIERSIDNVLYSI